MISGQELFAERETIKNSLKTSIDKAYGNGVQLAEKNSLISCSVATEDASA